MKIENARISLVVILLALIVAIPIACVAVSDDSDATAVNDYYYNQLESSELKEDYNKLYNGFKNGETTVKIGYYAGSEPFILYFAVMYDHPELFWLPNKVECGSYSSLLEKYVEIRIEPIFSSAVTTNYQAQIDSVVNTISIPNTTTFDKVKAMHDWIVSNVTYKQNAGDDNYIRNIYNTFVTKSIVCEGYSKAFKYLCDLNDIPCILVTGEGYNSSTSAGEDHMWTYVQMEDNKWYAVDVTWDDPIGGSTSKIRTDYFLIGSGTVVSNMTFSQSHVVDYTLNNGTNMGFKAPILSTSVYASSAGTGGTSSTTPSLPEIPEIPDIPDIPGIPDIPEGIIPGGDDVANTKYTVVDTTSKYKFTIEEINKAINAIGGSGEAVIYINGAGFAFNAKDLNLMKTYLEGQSADGFEFYASSKQMPFDFFGIYKFDRTVTTFSVTLNSNAVTDMSIIDRNFYMSLYVPYEKVLLDFDFFLNGYLIKDYNSNSVKKFNGKYVDTGVMITSNELGDYYGGSNEYLDISLVVFLIALSVILSIIVGILKVITKKKK